MSPVLHGGPKTRRNSYIFWGVAFLVWLVLELTGLFRRQNAQLRAIFPQFTVSETIWAAIDAAPWRPLRNLIRVALWAFLGLLASHLTLGTPIFPGLGH